MVLYENKAELVELFVDEEVLFGALKELLEQTIGLVFEVLKVLSEQLIYPDAFLDEGAEVLLHQLQLTNQPMVEVVPPLHKEAQIGSPLNIQWPRLFYVDEQIFGSPLLWNLDEIDQGNVWLFGTGDLLLGGCLE